MTPFGRPSGSLAAAEGVRGVYASNDGVVEWRRDEFVRLGLQYDVASDVAPLLALDRPGFAVDLHDFERLVRRGCRPGDALEILL